MDYRQNQMSRPVENQGRDKRGLRSKFPLFALIFLFLLLPRFAWAQINLSVVQELDFGSVAENGSGGTVTITAAGARNVTGVTAMAGTGAEARGLLRVTDATAPPVNVVVTIGTGPFSVTGPGTAMTISDFNINSDSGGDTETVSIPTSPTDIPIGATLTVNAGQTAGSYSGTFSVDVIYE